MRNADVRTDRCVWLLPPDESCAPVARSLAKQTLAPLRLSEDLVHDVAMAVSELATNALQHGLRRPAGNGAVGSPPELWIHHRIHPESQLVFRVFDPGRAWSRTARRPGEGHVGPDAEGGRGLGIVSALFGTWFAQLTRARLGPEPVPGKVVGFCVPVAGLSDVPRHPLATPAQAARHLHDRLAARGIDDVHSVSGGGMAVVFVRPGLTVYCHPEAFRWKDRKGTDVRRPLVDALEVTEAVVTRHEELDVLAPGSTPA